MALGLLMIMFVAMSVISIGGVILLFLLRNEKVKKGIYYFMTAWAMFVAIYSATGMPVNYVMQQVIAWGIGFLSVAGLLVYLKGRTDTAKIAAYALAAASSIGGVLYMFFW